MKNLSNTHIAIIGFILIIPALVLASCGILYSVFGLESANDLNDVFLETPLVGTLFSPIIIIGGPMIAFVLNAYHLCHVKLEMAGRTATISLSIKGSIANLIPASAGAFLIFIILLYGFVENFELVVR
jgi:hypothetical protein